MSVRADGSVRCTYCGSRGSGGVLVEADLRGVRFDYCDAACATAHRQAVEVGEVLCAGCDEPAVGDGDVCGEHLLGDDEPLLSPVAWRKAG